jgi:hypothetical protein
MRIHKLVIEMNNQPPFRRCIIQIVRIGVIFSLSLFHLTSGTELMQAGLLDQLSLFRERLLAFNKAMRSGLEEEESHYSRASGHSSPDRGIHHSRLSPSEPDIHAQSEPRKPSASPHRPVFVPLNKPALPSSDDSDSAAHQTTEVLSDSDDFAAAEHSKSPTSKRSLPVNDGKKSLTGTKDTASHLGKPQPKTTSKTAVSPIPAKKEKTAKPRSPVSIYFSANEGNRKSLNNSLLNLNDLLGESESADEAAADEI